MKSGDNEEGKSCVVMVTGGSGFLGQHVIKLLHSHADHVTSIRVVDRVPFVKRLDYNETKPVRSYVGDIADGELMRKAMEGCHSVIHIAALADSSMFPDKEKLEHVNVKGTVVTVLAALGTTSVQRLIGCGSMSVAISNDGSVVNGNEDIPLPKRRMFEEYASTKYTSKQMVLGANCERLSTTVIRPVLMYGELDNTYMPVVLQNVKASGGTFYRVNNGHHIHQHAYVGNIAWAFVCAERNLYMEQKTTCSETESSNAEGLKQFRPKKKPSSLQEETISSCSIAGNVFFAADDTPHQNIFEFEEQFITACGYGVSKWVIPYYLLLGVVYILYFILLCLSFC